MGPDSGGNVETTGALTGESFDKQKTLLEIYAAERRAGIRHAAPDIEVPDIDEFWKPIRDLLFLIWRVIAAGVPETGEELCRKIQKENISPVALLFVIRTATEKPEDILAPLADLFIDHQMLAHAYYLLKELQKQMSDVADIQELVTELERYL